MGTIIDDLEQPTWQRRRADAEDAAPAKAQGDRGPIFMGEEDEDQLEIPAFLRRAQS
jgi:hypothetical protein